MSSTALAGQVCLTDGVAQGRMMLRNAGQRQSFANIVGQQKGEIIKGLNL